jgi:DNA-directed RNA polymerase III subunit RPC3
MHVLEAVARERHGDDGVRIVRLLLDIRKMDEKQVLPLLVSS